MVTYGLDYIDYTNKFLAVLTSVLNDVVEHTRDQWIHYEYPTTNADLPSVTVKLGDITYEQLSEEDFLKDETVGGVYRKYFARQAVTKFEVTTWTNRNSNIKKQTYIFNGNKLLLTNGLACTAITEYVRNGIMSNRDAFIDQGFVDIALEGFESAFENGQLFWTGRVTGTTKFYSTWVEEYVNGTLIKAYDLSITPEGEGN